MKIIFRLLIFITLISCNSEDGTPEIPEVNPTNNYIKKATLIDDGQSTDSKEFFYNSNNKLYRIVNSSVKDTEITYIDDNISSIIVTEFNPNSVTEYDVSINNNIISLTSAVHIIEITHTNGFVDSYKTINQNPYLLILEANFTRNNDNNITSYEVTSPSRHILYNYSNYDNKNCSLAYNSFNTDYMQIFGLESSKNNPLNAEYIYNNEIPSLIDYILQYDTNDNVTQLKYDNIQVDYEYIEF